MIHDAPSTPQAAREVLQVWEWFETSIEQSLWIDNIWHQLFDALDLDVDLISPALAQRIRDFRRDAKEIQAIAAEGGCRLRALAERQDT